MSRHGPKTGVRRFGNCLTAIPPDDTGHDDDSRLHRSDYRGATTLALRPFLPFVITSTRVVRDSALEYLAANSGERLPLSVFSDCPVGRRP